MQCVGGVVFGAGCFGRRRSRAIMSLTHLQRPPWCLSTGTTCRSKSDVPKGETPPEADEKSGQPEKIAIDNRGLVEKMKRGMEASNRARKVWKFCETDNELKADIWEQVEVGRSIQEIQPPIEEFKAFGVVSPDKDHDMSVMVQHYTSPALAAGLRDREETLQLCARLLADGNIDQLKKVLHPYQEDIIMKRRRKNRTMDVSKGFNQKHLNMMRKYLHRAPRQLTRAVSVRASVVIPLCNVDGVASVLFERRSAFVRSFKNQVCFPGGIVEESMDLNIIETSLREMEEEIGVAAESVDVVGVLRCDWSEVAKLTGIGVTPVVAFLGDMATGKLRPNPSEVSECFTIPLHSLIDETKWRYEKEKDTVMFMGGPHLIWGLTAYITDRFLKDIVLKYRIVS